MLRASLSIRGKSSGFPAQEPYSEDRAPSLGPSRAFFFDGAATTHERGGGVAWISRGAGYGSSP